MTAPPTLRLTYTTISSPNPPALARFYAQLLGWTVTVESAGWAELPNPEGGPGLAFHIEDQYVRPAWPADDGQQQMMSHLDIRVDDLDEASNHAQACGATVAEFQPQESVRVHLDPDGHPFCLYVHTEE